MNCQKCNSPLNEGDKFCQVCGSVVDNNTPAAQPQPQPVEEPAVVTPEVAPAPVEVAQPTTEVAPTPAQQANVPMMNQPVQQPVQPPMPGPVPMAQPMPAQPAPMGAIPQEPAKKNNTIVIILGVLIAGLVIALAVLLLTGGKDDETNGGNNNNGNNGVTESGNNNSTPPTQVDTSTKTIVKQYTFILPQGYNAAEEDGAVVIFDDNNQVQASVESINAMFSQVSPEKVKSNMEGIGVTGITSKNITKNGKEMLIFTGTYQTHKVEYIYINHAPGKILGSAAIYAAYDTHKDTIYDILTKVTISENGYSNTAGFNKPGLTLEDAMK